jgi:hypothetical protein
VDGHNTIKILLGKAQGMPVLIPQHHKMSRHFLCTVPAKYQHTIRQQHAVIKHCFSLNSHYPEKVDLDFTHLNTEQKIPLSTNSNLQSR